MDLKKAVWQVQKRWSSYAKGTGKIVKKRPEERRNAFLAYSILKDAYLAVSFFFVLFLQRSCCRTKFMQSSCCWRGREAEVRRTRQVQAICKGNFFVLLFFFNFRKAGKKAPKFNRPSPRDLRPDQLNLLTYLISSDRDEPVTASPPARGNVAFHPFSLTKVIWSLCPQTWCCQSGSA